MSVSTAKSIARRVASWAQRIEALMPIDSTCGYCMSGSWYHYYQQYFFPNKMLNVEKLHAVIYQLQKLGYTASLSITPFESGEGIYMYMALRRA